MHIDATECPGNRSRGFSKIAPLLDFEKAKSKIGIFNFPEFVLKKFNLITDSAKTLWRFLYNESLFNIKSYITTTRHFISDEIHCCVKTVGRLLNELEMKGFIARTRKNRAIKIDVRVPESITDHIIYISQIQNSSINDQRDIAKSASPYLYNKYNINNNIQAVCRVKKKYQFPVPEAVDFDYFKYNRYPIPGKIRKITVSPIVYDFRKKKEEKKSQRDSDEKFKEDCSRRIQIISDKIQDLNKITKIEIIRRGDESLLGYMLRVNQFKTEKQRKAEEQLKEFDILRNELQNEILRIDNRWLPEEELPKNVQDFIEKPGCRTLTALDVTRLEKTPLAIVTRNEIAYAVRFGSLKKFSVPHAISIAIKLTYDGKWLKPKQMDRGLYG